MLKKTGKKKAEFILLISVAQIFLLINSITANSYALNGEELFNENLTIENKENSFLDFAFKLMLNFLTIKQIGSVSAQSSGCCIETNSGASCQPANDNSNCKNFQPTSCIPDADGNGGVLQCEQGTCIDEKYGTCAEKSPKKTCEDSRKKWDSREAKSIPQCQLGCCILGSNANYATQKQCDLLSSSAGIDNEDFRRGLTEMECIAAAQSLSEGACVLQGGNCRLIKGIECLNLKGKFYENLLCTNPSLDTNCEPMKETTCLDADTHKYDVYFKDTCGNQGNVYDASKVFDGTFDGNDEYWEKIIVDSCSGNPSECGKCNYPSESRCLPARDIDPKPAYGDNVCRDLKCGVVDEENRLNGESWCVYESKVGNSLDVVGSEHWLKYCEDGEVKIDKTQSRYRGEICAEKSETLQSGEVFSIAQYRTNLWSLCSQVSISDATSKEECEELPDCRVLSVAVSSTSGFLFDACVPKYPKGFDLSAGASDDGAKICAFATQTCTYVRVKEHEGDDWDPYGDSEACITQTFPNQINELCYSLGDCGGYVNIEGEYTKNYELKNKYGTGFGKNTKFLPEDIPENSYNGNEIPSANDDKPVYLHNPEDEGGYGDYGGLVGAPHVPSKEELALYNPENRDFLHIIGTVNWAVLKILDLFGLGGKIKQYPITFQCGLWQPSIGGANCEKCHEGELPCGKNKCESLGTGCGLINEDTENPLCVYKYSKDTAPPVIELVNITDHGELIDSSNISLEENGFEVTKCIGNYNVVNISLKTENGEGKEEYARCMYDYNTVLPGFEEITESYNLGDGEFFVEHNFQEVLSVSHPGIKNLITGLTETTGKLDMFVRCQDPAGNYNNNEYKISFQCVTSKDTTAPKILEFIPANNRFLKFGSTNSSLQILLNEPAQCKYDFNSGVDFDSMSKSFDFCNSDSDEGFLKGSCIANVKDLTGEENKIYIKCRDTGGNTYETDDITYTFFASPSELKIDSVLPQGEVKGSGEFVLVNLTAVTSGGSNDGNSFCSYKFESHPQYSPSPFLKTGGKKHETSFTRLPNGNYNAEVSCTDSAGNTAEGNSVFDLKTDSSPPIIARAFNQNGLKIITDEDAKCYYSNDNIKACDFGIDSANPMSSIFSTQHSANLETGETYYIKCSDIFGIENTGCAGIINSGF